MKYENFSQIVIIVKQIECLEKTLNLINSEPLIIIKRKFESENITIGLRDSDDYLDRSLQFIESIRNDIEIRITGLKKILESL